MRSLREVAFQSSIDIRQSTVKKWLLRLLLFTLFLGSLILFRAPLLTGMADLWIVDEPLAKADAIVVLGGNVQTRPFAAARLYAAGLAPKIVVINSELLATDQIGLTLPETQLVTQSLVAQGVPKEAIVAVGTNVSSTYEEALAVSEWVKKSNVRHLIVPTEPFHTRRVKWIFERILHPNGVAIEMKAIQSNYYSSANWWQTERGLIDFQNEVVKFSYYRFNF